MLHRLAAILQKLRTWLADKVRALRMTQWQPGTVPDRRGEHREALQLPLLLRLNGGVHALTRNVSASGMYIEVQGVQAVAGTLSFEMPVPERHMRFTAQGRIVRVEKLDGRTGVAVKLASQRLEPLA